MAKLTQKQRDAVVSMAVDRSMYGNCDIKQQIFEGAAATGEHCQHVAAYYERLAGAFWISAHDTCMELTAR